MNESTQTSGDYIVRHFEMGAVGGIYREIPFKSAASEKNADNMQDVVGDKKGPAGIKDAITANWAHPAREASSENHRKGGIARHQPRWDDRETVLANNSIDFLEINAKGQCATDLPCCRCVYLTRETGGFPNDAKRRRLDTEKASGLRTAAPASQHSQHAPLYRCMPCVMMQLFVIVFLMSASGLGLAIFYMTGHRLGSLRCDFLTGRYWR